MALEWNIALMILTIFWKDHLMVGALGRRRPSKKLFKSFLFRRKKRKNGG